MRSFSPLYSSFDISRWAAHAPLPRASDAATIPIPKSLTMASSVGDDMLVGIVPGAEVLSGFPPAGVRIVLPSRRPSDARHRDGELAALVFGHGDLPLLRELLGERE